MRLGLYLANVWTALRGGDARVADLYRAEATEAAQALRVADRRIGRQDEQIRYLRRVIAILTGRIENLKARVKPPVDQKALKARQIISSAAQQRSFGSEAQRVSLENWGYARLALDAREDVEAAARDIAVEILQGDGEVE